MRRFTHYIDCCFAGKTKFMKIIQRTNNENFQETWKQLNLFCMNLAQDDKNTQDLWNHTFQIIQADSVCLSMDINNKYSREREIRSVPQINPPKAQEHPRVGQIRAWVLLIHARENYTNNLINVIDIIKYNFPAIYWVKQLIKTFDHYHICMDNFTKSF